MRTRRLILPVLLGAALALAGCSAGDGAEMSEPAADRGVATQEEAAAVYERRGLYTYRF